MSDSLRRLLENAVFVSMYHPSQRGKPPQQRGGWSDGPACVIIAWAAFGEEERYDDSPILVSYGPAEVKQRLVSAGRTATLHSRTRSLPW